MRLQSGLTTRRSLGVPQQRQWDGRWRPPWASRDEDPDELGETTTRWTGPLDRDGWVPPRIEDPEAR